MYREEATDEMFNRATAACLAAGVIDENIIFEDETERVPSQQPALPFVQVFLRHANGGQRGFSAGGQATRKFDHQGILWLKIHTPNGSGSLGYAALASKLITYFEGLLSSNVSYANIRAIESGREGAFYVTDFKANFCYDEYVRLSNG